ncbi:UNVERIFIED_CONTAM: hypothetical protein Slati_2795700 [Sesamum latifolium]|uniref:Uncharacterized protein n=1 Tax=Sesamum latifolium TaxID=2727402 RepID=A0AAW2VB58_9LAMI
MTMLRTLFARPSASDKEILLRTQPPWRGRGRSERSPPAAAIDSSEGGVSGDGRTEEKKGDAPADLPEGPSNDPSTPAAKPDSILPPPTSSGLQDPEDPVCGEKV